jgi:hypothetical protein
MSRPEAGPTKYTIPRDGIELTRIQDLQQHQTPGRGEVSEQRAHLLCMIHPLLREDLDQARR